MDPAKVFYLKPKVILDYDIAVLLSTFRDRLIEVEKLEDIPQVSKEMFFAGSIGQIRKLFELQKIPYDPIEDYPRNLWKFYKRRIRKTTWEEANSKKGRYFIKPVYKGSFIPKIFNTPFTSDAGGLGYLNVSESCPVYVQGLLNIKAEFRCFVLNDEILGLMQYSGFKNAWEFYPDPPFIRDVHSIFFTERPAYCIDIGVLSNGNNVIIEVNDGYAFGSYGLNPRLYAKMQLATWEYWFRDKN